MQNINYFCIMKRIKYFFRCFFVLLLTILSTTSHAKENDSIEVYLLTCGPGEEVYTLYGHTAIRYKNLATHEDIAVNYGMFSFDQDFFILRFVFGQTDYEMGIMPFEYFKQAYLDEGRWVKERRLNLTREEKEALAVALNRNYQPKNREYRYNFIYNNCTTKARDIISEQIKGKINYHQIKYGITTYRREVSAYCANSPWARFGNDLLLGVKADHFITPEESHFLPMRLFEAFERATIEGPDSTQRKLVVSTRDVISEKMVAAPEMADKGKNILTPFILLSVLSVVILAFSIYGCFGKRLFVATDVAVLLLTGIGGFMLFLMVFSAHPTVSANLQILLFNPLNLFFLYPVVRKRKGSRWCWMVYAGCLVLFLAGRVIQCYAEGTIILALSLLIYSCIHFKRSPISPKNS